MENFMSKTVQRNVRLILCSDIFVMIGQCETHLLKYTYCTVRWTEQIISIQILFFSPRLNFEKKARTLIHS